jgi:hypothetical protein
VFRPRGDKIVQRNQEVPRIPHKSEFEQLIKYRLWQVPLNVCCTAMATKSPAMPRANSIHIDPEPSQQSILPHCFRLVRVSSQTVRDAGSGGLLDMNEQKLPVV